MSDEEEEEVIRWPDEGSYNPEPDEPEIEEKEPEEIEQEELEKQQAAEQLRAKLFGEGAPFAAEAPAWLQPRPAQEQPPQQAAPPPARRQAAPPLLRELQVASLGLTLRGGHITCDRSAPLGGDIKPLALTPALTGGAELAFRIGERWLGHNEIFVVLGSAIDAVRGGVQRCPQGSVWGYITQPGAYSVGGNSWWQERAADCGSIVHVQLVPAGASGRRVCISVDGRPLPTAGCNVQAQPDFVARGLAVRIGVLFSGDCRGDACEIIGSAGFH